MFYIYADGASIYNPLDKDLSIVAPKITLELGKAGSVQFSLPPSNIYYNKLNQLKTIITVEIDNKEIFRGRVLSIERQFNKMKTVYCEGSLAYLVDSVQKARSYKGKAHKLFSKIIKNHNDMMGNDEEKKFVVGNVEIEDADVIIPGKKDDDDAYVGNKYAQAVIESIVDEWLTSFDYINDVLIDYLGGYLVVRRVGSKNYLDFISADNLENQIIDASTNNTKVKEIDFGTNLIDLTEEVNAEEVFTVLIPLGDDNLTVKSVNNKSVEIVDKDAVARYGRIVKTHVFSDVNNASTLLSDGKKYLKAHKNIPITFTVKAIDMYFVDGSNQVIDIGEVVRVRSLPHDIAEYLICTKIEYDPDNPANNSYTFGNPKQTLTERYKKDKDKEKKTSKSHASHGGGGGAAAAKDDAVEEATDAAAENTENKLGDFYDAWIKVDPEDGHIDLGTLYKWTSGAMTRAGIDLKSGPNGSKVDIFSMNELVDEHGRQIGENKAQILATANDLESRIALNASYIKENSESIASINTWADETSSNLEILNSFKNETISGLATIKSSISDQGSTLDILTEFKDKINGDYYGKAGTKYWVDNNHASVETATSWVTKNSTALTSITSLTSKERSVITSLAQYQTTDEKGNILDRIAKIESSASTSESRINLMASFGKNDATFELKSSGGTTYATISAVNTEIKSVNTKISGTLTAAKAYADELVADCVKTKDLFSLFAAVGVNLTVGNKITAKQLSVDSIVMKTNSLSINGTSLTDYIKTVVKSEVTSTYVVDKIKNKAIQPSIVNATGKILATEVMIGSNKDHKMWDLFKKHKHDLSVGTSFGHQHKLADGSYTFGPKSSSFTVSGTTKKYTT